MVNCKVNLTIEVDQVGNGLAIQTPVTIQLRHEDNTWHAACDAPPVVTAPQPTLERALLDAAAQVQMEVQAAVCERPLILAKIGPEDIPFGM